MPYGKNYLSLPSSAFAPIHTPLPTTELIEWTTTVGDMQDVELEVPLPIPAEQLAEGSRHYGGLLTKAVATPEEVEEWNTSGDTYGYGTFDFEWTWETLARISLYHSSITRTVTVMNKAVEKAVIGRSEASSLLKSWIHTLESFHYYAVIRAAVQEQGSMYDQVFHCGMLYSISRLMDTRIRWQKLDPEGSTNPFVPEFVQGWVDEVGV